MCSSCIIKELTDTFSAPSVVRVSGVYIAVFPNLPVKHPLTGGSEAGRPKMSYP